MSMNRREMLQASLSSLAFYSTMATAPNWILRTANALPLAEAYDDRILVILQHSGGIDGLNTVIPRTDDIYYDAQTRPTIRVAKGAEINLDGWNGLHPQLARLADWYQKGHVGIIQNVGYLNPNLSHFTSTDIFEYGVNPMQASATKGWVAKFYDNQCSGCEPQPLDMVAAGKTDVPDALSGYAFYTPPAINNPTNYTIRAHDDNALRLRAIQELNGVKQAIPLLDFVQRSATMAQISVQDVMKASQLAPLVPATSYGSDSLGRGLKLVSQIIRAGFKTRVFYVSQGGYDTHANQVAPGNPLTQGDHPRLLGRFDQYMNAFLTEMEISGNLDRVLVMTFSEFGRRVQENGSYGTDHGAANCLFVLGGGVNGGVYGGQPDLLNLQRGNLIYTVDFRSVYTQIIESWFGSEAAPIFGSDIYTDRIVSDLPKIPFVKKTANG